MTSRTLRDWIALYPGTRAELQARLGVVPQTLWRLQTCGHARAPYPLLRRLARALQRPADGSEPPTFETLVRAWSAGRAQGAFPQ
jgi:hypothetical protein